MGPLLLVGAAHAAEPPPPVHVHDGGVTTNSATWECQAGHKVEKRTITLESGQVRYAFQLQGCVDPSHGDQRPCSEGNFGMPLPGPGNWYWGGFLRIDLNGVDACAHRIADCRVLESGGRGSFQVVFAHPDADVGVRMALPAGGNHVLAEIRWVPHEGVEINTVGVRLTCYPSFFTAARHRTGERHCRTARTDVKETSTLELVPAEDTWLYYYDAVFDPAGGEGDGPCAAAIAPEGYLGGTVSVTGYPVQTTVRCDPATGHARLAFYDFNGWTNAQAAAYLDDHGADDVAELATFDFRPLALQQFDLAKLRAEAEKLLADAGDDGTAMAPQVTKLLDQLTELAAKAKAGDWQAEAEIASLLHDSEDLFWRLRAFAVLNNA